MAELIRLLQTPGLEGIVVVFAAAFLTIRLGHALIGLLRAWDDYREDRVRRPGGPPSTG